MGLSPDRPVPSLKIRVKGLSSPSYPRYWDSWCPCLSTSLSSCLSISLVDSVSITNGITINISLVGRGICLLPQNGPLRILVTQRFYDNGFIFLSRDYRLFLYQI